MSALPLTPHPDPPPDPKVARAALRRLLESSEFQASNRLRHFIEFVVEETLRGRADQIKAYVIAVQVFGRPASFDPSSDNIVRVEARRLRAALDRYYESGGASDPLRIAMPTGGYRAVFERRTRSFPTHRERTEALPALAIVPLRNLGPQSDRFFAAGLAAELGVAFHKLRILRTVSLPPVAGPETEEAELRRACAEVGVRFVLHGSLQRAGPRVRVGIQLLDVDSGEHLWADLFDRKLEMEGVLDVQQEIVRRVASQVGDYHEGAVHQTLIREALQSTRCMSAYEAVLRGRYYSDRVTRRDHARAIAALDLAVQLDPGYAAAWADLGGVRASGYAHALADGSRNALLEQALAEAQRARDLDATLDRVHWNLGFVHLNLRNRAGVLRSAESLIALDPPRP